MVATTPETRKTLFQCPPWRGTCSQELLAHSSADHMSTLRAQLCVLVLLSYSLS